MSALSYGSTYRNYRLVRTSAQRTSPQYLCNSRFALKCSGTYLYRVYQRAYSKLPLRLRFLLVRLVQLFYRE